MYSSVWSKLLVISTSVELIAQESFVSSTKTKCRLYDCCIYWDGVVREFLNTLRDWLLLTFLKIFDGLKQFWEIALHKHLFNDLDYNFSEVWISFSNPLLKNITEKCPTFPKPPHPAVWIFLCPSAVMSHPMRWMISMKTVIRSPKGFVNIWSNTPCRYRHFVVVRT